MAGRKVEAIPRVPPLYCSQAFTAKAFGVTSAGVDTWVKAGCPRNDDGSYSIVTVYHWQMTKLKIKLQGSDLASRKAEKAIELQDAQIQKIKGNYIEKSIMETVLTSRAGNLRRFLMKTFIQNCVHIVGKSLDGTRTVMFDLIQQAMKSYIGDSNG